MERGKKGYTAKSQGWRLEGNNPSEPVRSISTIWVPTQNKVVSQRMPIKQVNKRTQISEFP